MTGRYMNSGCASRELQVVDLLAGGSGNNQIVIALNITGRTVEFHLTRIYEKHQVTSWMAIPTGDAQNSTAGHSIDAGSWS